MFVRHPLLLVLLFLALVFPVKAAGDPTPEGTALDSIATFTKYFESVKNRLPETWEELDHAWGKPLDQAFPYVVPTRRYQLFSPPAELPLGEGQSLRVVAMTRTPMWETTLTGSTGEELALKGPGRYVLHRDEGGDFHYRWFDETEIQRLWPGTGQALPVPDYEPERRWVEEARRGIMMKRVGIVGIIVFVVVWIVARVIGKRMRLARQLAARNVRVQFRMPHGVVGSTNPDGKNGKSGGE